MGQRPSTVPRYFARTLLLGQGSCSADRTSVRPIPPGQWHVGGSCYCTHEDHCPHHTDTRTSNPAVSAVVVRSRFLCEGANTSHLSFHTHTDWTRSGIVVAGSCCLECKQNSTLRHTFLDWERISLKARGDNSIRWVFRSLGNL